MHWWEGKKRLHIYLPSDLQTHTTRCSLAAAGDKRVLFSSNYTIKINFFNLLQGVQTLSFRIFQGVKLTWLCSLPEYLLIRSSHGKLRLWEAAQLCSLLANFPLKCFPPPHSKKLLFYLREKKRMWIENKTQKWFASQTSLGTSWERGRSKLPHPLN